MSRRRGSQPVDPIEADPATSRAARARWRRKRRRRRVARGLLRGAFWLLVLAGTLVLGIGIGRLAAGDGGSSSTVTIDHSRGRLTSTLPVTTVVSTRTVVQVRTVTGKKGKGTSPKSPKKTQTTAGA